jgi:hypothetical protein
MQNTQEAGATVGAKYSVFNCEALDTDLLELDAHVSGSLVTGSQKSLDYVWADDSQKIGAVMYILSSSAPTSSSIKTLNWIYNQFEPEFVDDYSEFGSASSLGGSASLFNIPGNGISIDGEYGVYQGERLYSDGYKEYLFQTPFNFGSNFVGTSLINWEFSESQVLL